MYFQKPGPENTDTVLELVSNTCLKQPTLSVVVASSTGKTALSLREKTDAEIVCVGYAFGSPSSGQNPMTEEVRRELMSKGVKVLHTSHVLSGVERGISNMAGGMYPAEILSNSLRIFGQGVKVCVEISIMALDAGLVPHGDQIIAIGGSSSGADTAIVITPAHANRVFETKIHKVLCKPAL